MLSTLLFASGVTLGAGINGQGAGRFGLLVLTGVLMVAAVMMETGLADMAASAASSLVQ